MVKTELERLSSVWQWVLATQIWLCVALLANLITSILHREGVSLVERRCLSDETPRTIAFVACFQGAL